MIVCWKCLNFVDPRDHSEWFEFGLNLVDARTELQ
jgi:hypothetical protein